MAIILTEKAAAEIQRVRDEQKLETDHFLRIGLAGGGLGAVLSFSGLGGIGVLIGLGFYMPFDIVLTYTIGNLLRIVTDRLAGRRFSEEVGVPIAAGLIVGEALVGVGYAFWQILLA